MYMILKKTHRYWVDIHCLYNYLVYIRSLLLSISFLQFQHLVKVLTLQWVFTLNIVLGPFIRSAINIRDYIAYVHLRIFN